MATPEALSLAPGPPESESPWAQKRMYFERSLPASVATTVSAESLPLFASSANEMRTFSPAVTFSRSEPDSRGETENTGTVHVPRNRPTPGHPDAEARPSNRTATHPAVVSGVGLRDARQTAPDAASIDTSPSPLPDGEPEKGHVVFRTTAALPAAAPIVRTSHDTGWYQSRGGSLRTVTSSPASLNAPASHAAASWFDGVPYIRVPKPTRRRTVSTIRVSEIVAARVRSALRSGAGGPACPRPQSGADSGRHDLRDADGGDGSTPGRFWYADVRYAVEPRGGRVAGRRVQGGGARSDRAQRSSTGLVPAGVVGSSNDGCGRRECSRRPEDNVALFRFAVGQG